MSLSKKDVEFEIRSLRKPINTHLLKLAIVDQHRTEEHWRAEISGWLFELASLKLNPKGNRTKYNTYYDILYKDFYDPDDAYTVQQQAENLKATYSISKDFNPEIVALRLKNFHKSFSKKACNNSFKVRADIMNFVIGFGGL